LGPPPPSVMGLRRRHLHFCVAWPTQVDFVFTVTLSMHRQDLEPILPTTQYSCMQPFSATHSHPPHGISANLIKLFPKYSSQSFADTREGVCISRVWIPNPCALPIIASVSPQPIPCLFACFYESVSYVYVLFSTCLSSCVASAEWVVFGFVFITTFLFSFFFPPNLIHIFGKVLLLYVWPCSYVCPPFLSACLLF